MKRSSIVLIIGFLMAGCTMPPPNQPEPPHKPAVLQKGQLPDVRAYDVGFLGSQIVRVVIPEDDVICYVSVESNALRSVQCLPKWQLKPPALPAEK